MRCDEEKKDKHPWMTRTWDSTAPHHVEKNKLIHGLQDTLRVMLQPKENRKAQIHWEEPQASIAGRPLKTSVSSIAKKNVLKDPMPLTDNDEDEETKRQAEIIVSPLRLSELPSKPAFMEDKHMTGAERGTVVHRALALIDLNALRTADSLSDALWQEIRRLESQGCLTKEETDVISHRSMAQFFEGNLGRRMLESSEVHREWSFNLRMEDEVTLLQGVIDCVFLEGGEWVLVDYKTDRIEDEQAFIQRYEMQLYWYQQALEKITGRRVREKWLYALGKQKGYLVGKKECFT